LKEQGRIQSFGIALRNDVRNRFTKPDLPAVWIYPGGLADARRKIVLVLVI
jgi:hypothetical protein